MAPAALATANAKVTTNHDFQRTWCAILSRHINYLRIHWYWSTNLWQVYLFVFYYFINLWMRLIFCTTQTLIRNTFWPDRSWRAIFSVHRFVNILMLTIEHSCQWLWHVYDWMYYIHEKNLLLFFSCSHVCSLTRLNWVGHLMKYYRSWCMHSTNARSGDREKKNDKVNNLHNFMIATFNLWWMLSID